MIEKPPNKSKQLIRNIELVHPKNFQGRNPAQLTITNVLSQERTHSWSNLLKYSNNQHSSHQRVQMTQQIPQMGNHTHLMIVQTLKVLQFKTIPQDET